MASIITRDKWMRQPTQSIGIDWSYPLAKGLKFVFDGARMQTVDSAAKVSTILGPPTFETSSIGIATKFSTAAGFQLGLDRPIFAGRSTGTFYCLIKANVFASNNIIFYEAGQGRNNFNIQVPASSSSPIVYNIADNTTRLTSKSSFNATTWYSIVISWVSTKSTIYIDGVFDSEHISDSNIGTATQNSTISGYWFDYGSRGYFTDASVALGCLYDHVLSEELIRELSFNPWQLFRKSTSRIYTLLSDEEAYHEILPSEPTVRRRRIYII